VNILCSIIQRWNLEVEMSDIERAILTLQRRDSRKTYELDVCNLEGRQLRLEESKLRCRISKVGRFRCRGRSL
jgi:hypothetical protein